MINSISNNAGFSVPSLLIASAIGVFLVGGVGKVYVDSKAAYGARTSIATATENARFAIDDLRRMIVMTGRGISAGADSSNSYDGSDSEGQRTFPAVAANDATIADTRENGNIVDIDFNGSSIIAFRYAQGPAPCGGSGTVAAITTVRFYVNNNQLVCDAGTALPLVSGIQRMRAVYGVDTDVDGFANHYLTASQVNADSRWNNVVSIRIGLIVSSGENALPTRYHPATEETLSLLGSDFLTTDISLFYKSVSTTISLRNLNTTVQRQ